MGPRDSLDALGEDEWTLDTVWKFWGGWVGPRNSLDFLRITKIYFPCSFSL